MLSIQQLFYSCCSGNRQSSVHVLILFNVLKGNRKACVYILAFLNKILTNVNKSLEII